MISFIYSKEGRLDFVTCRYKVRCLAELSGVYLEHKTDG